jgi:hypothetical protein
VELDGLDDEGLRRAMTPSGTNLLGLVKHLAAVEYGWFCQTFGRPTEPLPFNEDDENADLRVERMNPRPTFSPSTNVPGPRPIRSSTSSTSRTRAPRGSVTPCHCGGC